MALVRIDRVLNTSSARREVNVSLTANGNDDAILFQRFLDGEDDAFLRLYKKYNQRLHIYCLKIIGDQELAADIAQEMWEKVIQLRNDPQQVHNPGGLFLRIIRNLCIDHLRARRPSLSLDEVDDSPHFAYTPHEPSELEELALAALDKLSYEYREVLILNLYCGYRFDEIAVMTGKTPDAIWARASRARAQLRKMVGALVDPNDTTYPLSSPKRQTRTEGRA